MLYRLVAGMVTSGDFESHHSGDSRYNMPRLGLTYLEVREVSAGGVPHPQSDQSFLAVT